MMQTRELLGCKVSVHLGEGVEAGDLCELAFAECERIEGLYSRFIAGNELARVNSCLGDWQEISEELAGLIRVGLEAGQQSFGAFDLTVKSILEGWGYDSDYSLTEGAVGSVGGVELDGRRLRLSAEIDLGGLGKGYAIDRMAEILKDLPSVLIDAGGDMVGWGRASVDQAWKIVLEDPRDLGRAIGEVTFEGRMAVGASSPARRKWRDRHHLVDPIRGEPARGMMGVFTQAETALWADVYSTALFVLGFERAQQILPTLNVEAILVASDGRVFKSEGFRGELYRVADGVNTDR